MTFARVVRRILCGPSAWRTIDSVDVGAIARDRKIWRIKKELRELGHPQVAEMLERDEANDSIGSVIYER